jgi:hypothetical protein
MVTNRNGLNPNGQSSIWLGLGKFLFLVVLTATCFLLVRSMVRHHFFSGGQLNQHDRAGQ